MESIWSQTTTMEKREPLSQDVTAEAAVIGGGMAGILTAYFLQRKGIETVVLEGARMGSGQTRHTTAKISSQHNLIYDKLIRQVGQEKASQYAHANQQAIRDYERIIGEEHIECEFELLPACLYSTRQEDLLKREAEAAVNLGIDAHFLTQSALPFPVKGVLQFPRQAQFHPLKFLRAISQHLTVYENTYVKTVEDDRIITDQGTVKARHIVFATHFPFLNIPGYYFMRMHQERSYVLALENAQQLPAMYLGIDSDGLSFRNRGKLMLLGGGSHRTGENSKGGKYQKLLNAADSYWPGSRETARWSAQDCMSLDQIPFIGAYSSSTPSWYVATGFGKWGMTGSMTAARLLSQQIAGEESPDAEVFSPQRLDLSASAKNLAKDSLQAAKGLTRRIFEQPTAQMDALPSGHGGIVEVNGEKTGVFKDETGQIFAVSVRCPHMGCQLEWNPDERSWDCPCHGSRFDYRGALLDNPAQTPLDAIGSAHSDSSKEEISGQAPLPANTRQDLQ